MKSPLQIIAEEVCACRKCPRLTEYREKVAREKRRAFRGWEYWGRPVPGFGDAGAKLFILGLAPAAHGGNRTGRVFTGDRSGDFLFKALYEARFANQPTSLHRDDGLKLKNAYIAAAVRCAPPSEQAAAERDFELPRLSGTRVGDFAAEGDFGTGQNCVGCLSGDFEGRGEDRVARSV